VAAINKQSLGISTSPNYKFKYVDLSCVDKGIISFPIDMVTFTSAPSRARRIFNKDDILMSTVRPNLQSFVYIDFDATDCIASTGFAVLSASDKINARYLYCLLYSYEITKQINNMLVGSNYPAINNDDVASLIIFLPSLSEQIAIADVLTTWDDVLGLLDKKIEIKKKQKQYMMQQLLSVTIRLPGFDKPWKKVRLRDIAAIASGTTKSTHQIDNGQYFIVDMGAISSEGRLVPTKQTNHNSDFLVAGDLVMPKDDIGGGNIIGKTAIIPRNDKYILGDHVFKIVIQDADNVFISYLINSFNVNKAIRRLTTGSAQLGLAKRDIEKISLKIPDNLAEQTAIADVLVAADDEIKLLEQQRSQINLQKKYLMQNLLAGKIRVPPYNKGNKDD
jgi:type I restriction enzyme S subunit